MAPRYGDRNPVTLDPSDCAEEATPPGQPGDDDAALWDFDAAVEQQAELGSEADEAWDVLQRTSSLSAFSQPVDEGGGHASAGDLCAPVFIAARSFEGARRGMVVQAGPKGLGYYADDLQWQRVARHNPADDLLLQYIAPPQVQSGRVCIRLEALLVRDSDLQPGQRAPRRCKRNRKRRRQGVRCVLDESWNASLSQGALKRNAGHRKAGVWAFDSYNGNTMATAQQYLEQSGVWS